MKSRNAQVRQDLCLVHGDNFFDCFYLNDYLLRTMRSIR
jgi:hypothetical protein